MSNIEPTSEWLARMLADYPDEVGITVKIGMRSLTTQLGILREAFAIERNMPRGEEAAA